MYNVKFKDLFNILDRGCGDISVFKEFDNRCLFCTSHQSYNDGKFEDVAEMIVTQVSNHNGDDWTIYVRESVK